MRKLNVWDYMFYGSMLVLTVWLILKVTGVINTPVWLEYGVPSAGIIIGVFSLYHNLLKNLMHIVIKVDHLESDVHVLKDGVDVLKSDVHTLKDDMRTVKHDISLLKEEHTPFL